MTPCGINITSVSGKPLFVSPNGCRSNVTVAGTVTTTGNPCPAVSVTISCQCGSTTCSMTGSVDANGVLTNASSGYLVNGQWQLVIMASCCCDAQVKVSASCPAYPGCDTKLLTNLSCDKCCPAVTAEVGYGPCDDKGQSNVTFTIHVDVPPGCPPVKAHLDFGDGSAPGASHSFSGSSSFTWSHPYSSGSYLAQLVIDGPDDCPSLGVPVKVNCPKTDCCPTVSTSLSYGECKDGHSTVTLTTTYHVPRGCPDAELQTNFGDNGPLGAPHSVSGSGTIVETRVYPTGSYVGHVLVNVPKGCAATPFNVVVECPSKNCCPTIATELKYGPCKEGQAPVTFHVSVTVPPGCPPVTVQMDFGDGTHSIPHSFASSGSFTETHSYPTGSYVALVNVVTPAGCHPQKVEVNVECTPPDCCPQISAEVKTGKCDGAGNAVVTVTVSVTPKPAPCPPAKVQIDFGGGDLSAVHTFSSPGSFTETRPYSAGPHPAQIIVLSPKGCHSTALDIFVHCPECCPDVSVTPCVPDCGDAPDRTVKFQVTVTPKPAPCPPKAVSFQMDFGDGDYGQPYTIPAGGGAFSYTETHTYTGADALQDNTAALTVSEPPECAGTYGSAVIPKCCTKKRANFCRHLFWWMSWAFVLAVLAFLSYLFGSLFSPPVSLIAFYILAGIGVLLLIAFLLHCPKCRCGWVWRLLWRVFFGAGLLYAINAACTIFHWQTVLIGALMILLAFFFLQQWRKKCCVTECNWLKEILFWFAFNILVLASLLLTTTLGSGCQFVLFTIWTIKVTILGVATFVAGLLGNYYLQKCTK